MKFAHLNCLSRGIRNWCEERNIWIFDSYIASKDYIASKVYIEADKESRIKNPDTKWELASFAYDKIVKVFFKSEIDLFVFVSNTKCQLMRSWKKSPQTRAIADLTSSWRKKYFYAFLAFSMILKTLKNIKTNKAYEVTVVSLWTPHPW